MNRVCRWSGLRRRLRSGRPVSALRVCRRARWRANLRASIDGAVATSLRIEQCLGLCLGFFKFCVRFFLVFNNPKNRPINYSLRLFAGFGLG